jgi:hypothetical protein
MDILRSYGQFDLNEDTLTGLFNVTNRILLEQTTDVGASFWFGEELKNKLMRMGDATFGRRCKELAGNSIEPQKTYNVMFNVGKAKYVINDCDGVQRHDDGGLFSGIEIFSNKKKFKKRIKELEILGYIYKS